MNPRPTASRLASTMFRLVPGLAIAAVLGAQAQRHGAEQLTRPSNTLRSPATGAIPKVPTSTAPIQIRIGPYFGWNRSITISNGKVEAVAVPAVGRVMQFRFVGQSSPFWEDPALRGKDPDPKSSDWGNFGGDKTWPSPQSDWSQHTQRGWPPPPAFDSMPVEASIRRDTVVLTSPVDPYYGIRTERVIALAHDAPVMTITTTYEKVDGAPVKAGIWVITQLDEPVGVFCPVPTRSKFETGYDPQSGNELPANLKVDRALLSLTRDPRKSTKIGTDSSRLLWVGSTQMLLIDSPRIANAEYPDNGSSAEVYTNPDPRTYVELEMLGPVKLLKPGDTLQQVNTYSLLPRQSSDAATDARRVLGLSR